MIKSFKKIFAIMLSVFMLSLFTVSAFALENVSTMLDGHFPDSASYWYNFFDDKTEFDLFGISKYIWKKSNRNYNRS